VTRNRREIVAWVGSHVVPHEADLRARLRRMAVPEDEVGDIVQDAYVKIARLDDVSHIRSGRAYFFSTARSVLLDRIRHDRIVRIDSLTEADMLALADDDPGPERRASARQELERVRQLIAELPERCRVIFEMRRIEGVPQREIAERLCVPEHTVEAQAIRGLKLILKAIAGESMEAMPSRRGSRKESERDEQRNE
jgi:RNA polymerase sigma factor (sigma-70 family)